MDPDENNNKVLPKEIEAENENEKELLKFLSDIMEGVAQEYSEEFVTAVEKAGPYGKLKAIEMHQNSTSGGSPAMDQDSATTAVRPAEFRTLAEFNKVCRRGNSVPRRAKPGTNQKDMVQKFKGVKEPKSKAEKSTDQGSSPKPAFQSWNDARSFFFCKYPGVFMPEFDFTKFLFDPNGVKEVPQLVEKVVEDLCCLKNPASSKYRAKHGKKYCETRKMLQDRQERQVEDGLIKYK